MRTRRHLGVARGTRLDGLPTNSNWASIRVTLLFAFSRISAPVRSPVLNPKLHHHHHLSPPSLRASPHLQRQCLRRLSAVSADEPPPLLPSIFRFPSSPTHNITMLSSRLLSRTAVRSAALRPQSSTYVVPVAPCPVLLSYRRCSLWPSDRPLQNLVRVARPPLNSLTPHCSLPTVASLPSRWSRGYASSAG